MAAHNTDHDEIIIHDICDLLTSTIRNLSVVLTKMAAMMRMMVMVTMMAMMMMAMMTYSSTCAEGTWKLPIYNNANKRLRYWSSDYKYRLSIVNTNTNTGWAL